MSGVPAVVVAAPASGHGKTTVATGLVAAFAARGLRVAPFKVGPDYIDPGYHALAAGRVARNLDPYLVGAERIAPLFRHGTQGADIAVVEGVMGLYDGAVGHGELASTAQVAKLLGAPVLLVVDARGQGRSVAALVSGFRAFDPEVRIAGVVLNRVGGARHVEILREALDAIGVPVLGALGRSDEVSWPSRHLGLVPVAERHADALASVRSLCGLVSVSVDLDAVLALARTARHGQVSAWDAAEEVRGPVSGHVSVAVAGGRAFTFHYAEHAELLAAAGAEVVPVDPLTDETLPAGVSGLVIGGGFPEAYAGQLGANEPLRKAIAGFARDGGVVAAECAGLLYLSRSLDGAPMCGVIDADAEMTPRLTLGYREATACADSPLAEAGARVRGHEFHRTALTGSPYATPGVPPYATPAWRWRRDGAGEVTDGRAGARLHASYLHLHPAGYPETVRRYVATCASQEMRS